MSFSSWEEFTCCALYHVMQTLSVIFTVRALSDEQTQEKVPPSGFNR